MEGGQTMLESLLTAFIVAFLTSAAVNFALQWEQRVRLRRCEKTLDEMLDVEYRNQKREAARASVEARRSKANAFDQAVVGRLTGVDMSRSNYPGLDVGGMSDFVHESAKGRKNGPA
jgi:hypothetical protein